MLYRTPLAEIDFWATTPASKTLLPNYFAACGLPVPKTEYYLIAEMMSVSEIPAEVGDMLDAIAEAIHLSPSANAESPSEED